ncbi:peroxidase 56-like isoform X1 [Triticum dicoccoides]|uniref:peroxidase 56-like isoform X1 n=1 Tax=Triticum dicoccoides TaxID=85692 RepID=UPI00188FB7EC|nr:peroxidase 56-like isoform X1 [Triticum dicoccoides]
MLGRSTPASKFNLLLLISSPSVSSRLTRVKFQRLLSSCFPPSRPSNLARRRLDSALFLRSGRMALDVLLRLLILAAVASAMPVPGPTDPAAAGLAIGFYNKTCPKAEELVLEEMRDIVHEDRTLGPALLRLLFHDCFVRVRAALLLCRAVPRRVHGSSECVSLNLNWMRGLQGCDGSIMLKSRSKKGERDAMPMSYSLRGFDEVERIKAKLEDECPLTVSCADIIIMAARDAVYLSNGPRFPVETGRRDGKVSLCIDAENDLAPPHANIVDLKTYFSVKNLSWKDLVVLSGSHTIGRAQCAAFAADRLYNNSGLGVQDPTLDKAYAPELRERCEPGNKEDETPVDMDPKSPYEFDLSYYRDVLSNKTLFVSDQALLDDRWTRDYVARMAAAESTEEYFEDYAAAMINMGRMEVLTGGNGEIRKFCSVYVD